MGDYYDSIYEQQCPACKTTKYRNPQMKLMVNVCGHALCDSCVKLLFIKEGGECPECDMILKRSKFRIQIFEDPLVEKEIDIRRRVMRVYVKQEEDFDTSEEWNEYLEEIEELVYNLVNDINKIECEKKLEYLEKHNKDDIRRNYAKKSRADEELEKLIEEQKIRELERIRQEREEEESVKLNKIKTQSSLLQDLMSSEGDASLIVKSHADKLKQELEKEKEEKIKNEINTKHTRSFQFSSGIKFGLSGGNGESNDVPILQHGENYTYEPPELPNSLQAPSVDELEAKGYLNNVKSAPAQSKAGGYTEHYACLRALQEFMWGHVLSS